VPSITSWEGWSEPAEAGPISQDQSAHEQERAAAEAGLRSEFDKRLAEEMHKSFEAGRERGKQEGRQAEREAQAAALAAAAQQRTRQAAN